MGALSKMISLWPDVLDHGANREDAKNLLRAIREQSVVISSTSSQIRGFLDSVKHLPRLTTDLNRAKRAVATELERLISLLQSQHDTLAQTEMSVELLLAEKRGG
jgi:hypothetical protein